MAAARDAIGAAAAAAAEDASARAAKAVAALTEQEEEEAAAENADEVRSIHWSPYDRVGVVNADP